jgi:hypothetical protein
MVRKQIYTAICLFNKQIFDGTTLAKNYITCYMNISILAITVFLIYVISINLKQTRQYFNHDETKSNIYL